MQFVEFSKYFKETLNYGLNYSEYPSVLEGFTDASWITNKEDHASTSGWTFVLGGGAVSWGPKKQTCITNTTMTSEFVALVSTSKEAEWLRNLLYEIPPFGRNQYHLFHFTVTVKLRFQGHTAKSTMENQDILV